MTSSPKLTPEQKADSARLMATFQQWKADERARGKPATQEYVAHALGISQSAFSQFCRGVRAVNAELLSNTHRLFGWDPADISPSLARKMAEFADAAGAADIGDHASVLLVDAKASAGKGELVFSDDTNKALMFRRDWLAKNDAKPDSTIAFEVDGDSMVDMHIVHGAVVLANRKKTEPVSKRVYIVWIDGKLYVKQLVKRDGMWWAKSHNAAQADDYPDILIQSLDDRVVGRAFWCGFGL